MVHTKTEQTWESKISYQRDKDYSWHQLHLELWSETDPKAKNTNILCVTWGQLGVTLTIKSSIFYLPLLILKQRQWYNMIGYWRDIMMSATWNSLCFHCGVFLCRTPSLSWLWHYRTYCRIGMNLWNSLHANAQQLSDV